MKRILVICCLVICCQAGFSQSGDGIFQTVTASGTNTYTITPALPAGYDPKEKWIVTFTNASTGSVTLNRAGLGAKMVKDSEGNQLGSGDIIAGQRLLLSYNGTYYQVVGGSGGGGDWGEIEGTLSAQEDLQSALDAKVAQTITDGVTSSAPSQDAIYDAFSTVPIVSVTGTTTLDATAFGKIHIFSGTSADYTVNLVTAVGNTGKSITFKGSPSLTKIVTLDASGSQTIDLSLTKTLVTSESFTLISDGSVWLQVGNSYGTWYTYVPSYTGFSTAPTNNVSRFTVIGRTVIAFIGGSTNGTSNATTFTVTLPIAASTLFAHVISVNVMYINNGSGGATPGYVAGSAGSNVLTVYRDFNGTGWTASGAKNAFINIIYEID